MSRIFRSAALLLFLLAAAGCNLFTAMPPAPTLPPTQVLPSVLPSDTPAAVIPAEILPSNTPQPSQTPTVLTLSPIQGVINADNFKLHSGPSFLFDTIALYKQGESVQVLGRSEGDNWLFVQTSDFRSGWMKMEYVALAGPLNKLPVIDFTNATIIRGHVLNSSKQPMKEIGIVIFPASSANPATESDNTVTDENGAYTLYLPKDLKGSYTIGINAYSCTSNAVDSQCQFNYLFPPSKNFDLPAVPGFTVDFVLEPI